MNERVKQLWVEALKSKRFRQGKGFLKVVEAGIAKRCPLGVLCELHAQETSGVWSARVPMEKSRSIFEYHSSIQTPPDKVKEWAGLPERNPMVLDDVGRCAGLSDLNDELGYSLERIANIIEEQL